MSIDESGYVSSYVFRHCGLMNQITLNLLLIQRAPLHVLFSPMVDEGSLTEPFWQNHSPSQVLYQSQFAQAS